MRKATTFIYYSFLLKSISIPAFREEGDPYLKSLIFPLNQFQSPPSVRKATSILHLVFFLHFISIPAFREEGDILSIRLPSAK